MKSTQVYMEVNLAVRTTNRIVLQQQNHSATVFSSNFAHFFLLLFPFLQVINEGDTATNPKKLKQELPLPILGIETFSDLKSQRASITLIVVLSQDPTQVSCMVTSLFRTSKPFLNRTQIECEVSPPVRF